MKLPRASVIIPAYNSEKTIGECLKALKSQSAKPLEIIVVDDGSQDRTIRKSRTPGVKILAQRHAGPAAARNRGARSAGGDIVLFTDADCIPEKSWLGEMLKPFRDKDIAGVQGSYTTDQKSLVSRFVQYEIEDRYKRMEKRASIDFIGTYSAAYRKELFLKFGGFDESFPEASGEDPELSFRLSKSGHKMVFNPGASVRHSHPETLGKYLGQKFGRARWRIQLYRKHPGKAVSESYTPQTLKIQIALFCLFVLSLIVSVAYPASLYPAGILLILLFLSTIPFSIGAGRKETVLGFISPPVLILRSVAFSLGLLYGALESI